MGKDRQQTHKTQSDGTAFYVISAFELSLILVAFLIGWWFAFDPRHDLRPGIALDDFLKNSVLGLIATIPLFALLFFIESSSWLIVAQARQFIHQRIVPLVSPLAMWQLVVLGAAAGIGEEILFRGAIQFAISEWTSVFLAVIISSVIFALAHCVTWWYALLAGCASLYLGWLFIATESMIPPVVAHAVYDIAALIYLTRKVEPRRENPQADDLDGCPTT